ncbi:YihY family inner membrane protein [bacterium]|nr:YihY family inner membrane protein [candidate division CSSED10-310 bacterium]
MRVDVGRIKTGAMKVHDLLKGDLLKIEISPGARIKKLILRQTQVLYLVIRGFRADKCSLHASSLTYMTLFSIVPLFAFGFALSKGFGVANAIRPLLDRLTVGQQDVALYLLEYINRTNVGALGTIGLLTLVITIVATFSKVESTFNTIWGVKKSRSVSRKITDYISVVVVVPILIVASTGLNTTLASNTMVNKLRSFMIISDIINFSFKASPYVIIWIAFTFLYSFIPNTRVRTWPSLYGGVIAGSIWQGAQWGFIRFQVGVSKYNALYGTFASLPIFLLWVYISWNIILLGAQFSYVRQNIRTIREQIDPRLISEFVREILAVRIMLSIVEQFRAGGAPLNGTTLAERIGVPVKVVRDLLFRMIDLGLITEVTNGPLAVVLAVPPERVTVRYVISTLHNWEPIHLSYDRDQIITRIEKLLTHHMQSRSDKDMDAPLHTLFHSEPSQ